MKLGAMKKRSRKEMAAVKGEEAELKKNRHQFLLDYKQLKEDVLSGNLA